MVLDETTSENLSLKRSKNQQSDKEVQDMLTSNKTNLSSHEFQNKVSTKSKLIKKGKWIVKLEKIDHKNVLENTT